MKEETIIRELINRYLRTENEVTHAFVVDGQIYELNIRRSVSKRQTEEIVERVIPHGKSKLNHTKTQAD